MSAKGYFENGSDDEETSLINSEDEVETENEEEELNSDGDEEIDEEEEEDQEDISKHVQEMIMDDNENMEDDDDEEDDDEADENYLQKFNNDINRNYIVDVHPECVIHNQSEIQTLSIVVRNMNNIIIDELHKTLPFLTKFERARILGQRAKQINSGSKPFVEVHPDIIDGYKIAELELEQKKIPFIIRRPLTNGSSEYWKVSDLENISF